MSGVVELFTKEDFDEPDADFNRVYEVRPALITYTERDEHPIGQWRDYTNRPSTNPVGRRNPITTFPIQRVSENEYIFNRASISNRWGISRKWDFRIIFNQFGMWLNVYKKGDIWESENLYIA